MVILIPTWILALYVALIHRTAGRPQPTEMWIATAIVTLACAVLA
jgi:hypothetical protein